MVCAQRCSAGLLNEDCCCFKQSEDKERDKKWKLPEYFNVSTKRTNVPLV